MPDKLSRFWQELKQRNVIRVTTVYAAAAFVILELVDIVAPSLGMPVWTLNLVLILLIVGFIIAIIHSWIYDVTPAGISKTGSIKEAGEDMQGSPDRLKAWKVATYFSLLVIAGLVALHLVSSRKINAAGKEMDTSIAVLPFENWNSDEAYYYLGDAIADELILRLWQLDAFDRVLSRSSTVKYREGRMNIPEISVELGVNYIIEGSIQKQMDQVRIRVQVIRAKNEDHIWAHEYNGQWNEILAIQDDIAKSVAEELKIVLTAPQLRILEDDPTEDLQAYEYYLLGEHNRHQRTPESLERAKDLLAMAIEKDPKFVRAFTSLATGYGNLAFCAFKAIGSVELFYHYDFDAAEKAYRKAVELEPNNPEIFKNYSELLFFGGRFQEAVEMDKKALVLDPAFPLTDGLYWVHLYFAGERDPAISSLKRLSGQYEVCHFYLGVIYLHEADYQSATQELKKTLASFSPISCTQLGLVYNRSGEPEKTQSMLDTLENRASSGFVPYSMRGALLAELGREKEALEYLKMAYDEREEYLLLMLNIDTVSYAYLRSDPRFLAVMENVLPGD